MIIQFMYKGRYHIRDAATIEVLSAIAKKYNYETALVYDQDLFGVTDNVMSNSFLNKIVSSDEAVVRAAGKRYPDIVVFLDGFARRGWNDGMARRVKALLPAVKTVCCTHTELPDFAHYDDLVVGEPEYAFEQYLKEGFAKEPRGVLTVSGLADLNELPLPDKELFSPYVNFKDSYLVYTTKGCPYPCSYCEETLYRNQLGKGYYRRRTAENIISELRNAKERFGITEVIYKDSVFTWDRAWMAQFLELYTEYIDVPFKCFAKAHAFDDEMARMIKQAGCYCVEFGVQTFNYEIKKNVLHRDEDTETLVRAFSLCAQHALRYDVDHMFGIPGESVADHLEAARNYAALQHVNRIKCHNLVFYEGAQIHNYVLPQDTKLCEATSDFFSSVSGTGEMVAVNKAFQQYFKVLPLLPRAINKWMIEREGWKSFRYIPYVFILLCMIILAFKNGDRRFWFYCKYYPLKIWCAIRMRLCE